jgi:hypothetical protein
MPGIVAEARTSPTIAIAVMLSDGGVQYNRYGFTPLGGMLYTTASTVKIAI